MISSSIRHVLVGLCVSILLAGSPAEAAPKTAHKSSASNAKKSSRAPAANSKKKSTVNNAGEQSCKTVRVKTKKGYRTTRKCTSEGPLKSPIGAGALESPQTGGKPELKARTIPDRAYAVDGYTFFHQGRKYRILGINEELVPAGSDLAKQRLQMALDSGQITVEPEAIDDNGTTRALVRVGGKNLADVLNAK